MRRYSDVATSLIPSLHAVYAIHRRKAWAVTGGRMAEVVIAPSMASEVHYLRGEVKSIVDLLLERLPDFQYCVYGEIVLSALLSTLGFHTLESDPRR